MNVPGTQGPTSLLEDEGRVGLTRHRPGHPAGCTIPSVTQDTGRSVQGQQPPHPHPGGTEARTATERGPHKLTCTGLPAPSSQLAQHLLLHARLPQRWDPWPPLGPGGRWEGGTRLLPDFLQLSSSGTVKLNHLSETVSRSGREFTPRHPVSRSPLCPATSTRQR